MTETKTITSKERSLAALAHGSVILGFLTNGIGGVIVAVLIWLTQREKSTYAAFQAMQAAAYQIIGAAVMLLAWCVWLAFYAVTWIPMIPQLEQDPNTLPPIFWIGIGSMVIPLAVMGLWVLIGLWGALRAYQGRDFRYPGIGRWVENYLQGQED